MTESPVAGTEPAELGVARLSQYDSFAAIYDRHFGHFAVRVAPVVERLLPQLPPGGSILDLCCGTGQLAAALTDRGLRVTGIDGSPQMLRFAQRNAPGATFHLDDARSFRLPESFHAAVSTFDSINHFLEPAELISSFRSVLRALVPGGAFVFDLNMEEGFRCRWWGTWQGSIDGLAYEVRAAYCPVTKTGRNIVTLVQDHPAAHREIVFVERCYSEAEVLEALLTAGFAQVAVHDAHRDLGLPGEIGRSFFVALKADRPGASPPGLARRFRRRSRDSCIADGLWPTAAAERELGADSLRLQAIEEVLCSLSDEPYELLRHQAGRWQWFITSHLVLGQVFQPPAPALVYLSPLLEQQNWPVVVTVVVHELAHLILNHKLTELDRPAYDDQESAVRQSIREWGFQAEADEADVQLSRQAWQGLVFVPQSGTN